MNNQIYLNYWSLPNSPQATCYNVHTDASKSVTLKYFEIINMLRVRQCVLSQHWFDKFLHWEYAGFASFELYPLPYKFILGLQSKRGKKPMAWKEKKESKKYWQQYFSKIPGKEDQSKAILRTLVERKKRRQ